MRTTVVSVSILLLFLLMLELLFRLVVYIENGSIEDRFLVLPDAALGWVLNTRMQPKHLKNRCGEPVDMASPVHRLILKSPRPPNGNRQRMLFLGDSYTHAHEVSTGKAYYDVFEQLEQDHYAVYVVGVGGYGSVQEYLALREVYPQIQPDIVVWQLTGNDVGNNVYELDDSSIYNNQRPRPYLNPENDEMEMKIPGPWLFDWSDGFAYVFKKLVIIDGEYGLGLLRWLDSLSRLDTDTRRRFEQQGLAVLDRVVGRAVNNYPDSTFIGFSVNSTFDKDYEQIFLRHGAFYLTAFHRELRNGQKTDCSPLDGHWNHSGNEIAGRALSRRIRDILAPGEGHNP